MRSFLRPTPVERARPALGTIVAIRAAFAEPQAAYAAIDAAFAEVALVHRLMSFHDPQSDLSRVNCEAFRQEVRVDPRTFEVLQFALELAEASDGAFDPAVAAQAVAAGALPPPASSTIPDAQASWRDVQLDPAACAVRLGKPMWLDLGGVAKGYAVDLALEALRAAGCAQASVNAGGDLRVTGPDGELVHLRCGLETPDVVPAVELQDAAAASSGSHLDPAFAAGVHLDGRTRKPVAPARFATVVAATCMVADALTKPVLAQGAASAGLLRRYGALAHLLDGDFGWKSFGATPR